MGGSGSGRWFWHSSKDTADSCRRIDINFMLRQGYLRPGRQFALSWKRGNESCGWIGGVAKENHVVFAYKARERGGEWQDIEETVPIVYTPCNYGGQRPWFICPGVISGRTCRRRVGTLYGGGWYYLCRHCYDLAYQSQREDVGDRLLSKAQAIRKRLGGSQSVDDVFPPKPKGMHWKTYTMLCEEARQAERISLHMTAVRFGLYR